MAVQPFSVTSDPFQTPMMLSIDNSSLFTYVNDFLLLFFRDLWRKRSYEGETSIMWRNSEMNEQGYTDACHGWEYFDLQSISHDPNNIRCTVAVSFVVIGSLLRRYLSILVVGAGWLEFLDGLDHRKCPAGQVAYIFRKKLTIVSRPKSTCMYRSRPFGFWNCFSSLSVFPFILSLNKISLFLWL